MKGRLRRAVVALVLCVVAGGLASALAAGEPRKLDVSDLEQVKGLFIKRSGGDVPLNLNNDEVFRLVRGRVLASLHAERELLLLILALTWNTALAQGGDASCLDAPGKSLRSGLRNLQERSVKDRQEVVEAMPRLKRRELIALYEDLDRLLVEEQRVVRELAASLP